MQLPMLTADATAPATRGDVHVHFGDWREQEPSWPRPFVYVSDPPYGQRFGAAKDLWTQTNGEVKPMITIVGDGDTRERDAAMDTHGWTAAALFGPRRIDRIAPWGDPKEIVVWDKAGRAAGDFNFFAKGSWETICIYGRGWLPPGQGGALHGVTRRMLDRASDHPHEKPVDVVARIIRHVPPDVPIADPFMGSGTTAVACALLGREFWGAEIDPQYFDVIRGRLAAVGVHIDAPSRAAK